MAFPLTIPDALKDAVPTGSGVLLGVSGGVDSSLALAVLQHLGCDVHCVTLKNFCTSEGQFGGDNNSSCCSLDAIDSARRQAASVGVGHWVSNVEEHFQEAVIAPFVAEYQAGRTPNPCIGCNTHVRFPELIKRADQMGLEYVATGHYARVEHTGSGPRLLRAVDRDKDQSYFLHGLTRDELARAVFPLGWWIKPEVRRAAKALGLESANRDESQEICFVPNDDRSFLFEAQDTQGGDIVDAQGEVIGRHRGLIHYTVGQRRGLGIAASEPLYVVRLDAKQNRIIAGPRSALAVNRLIIDQCRWLSTPTGDNLKVQWRHGHRGDPVSAILIDGDRCEVRLENEASGIAPGQYLVVERDGEVLGGGRIIETRGPGEDQG
jgi:tRNA-uridine 2-sulfurtransferase